MTGGTFLPITYSPLVPIDIASIYNGPLPKRLALCTPDTKAAILAVAGDLTALGFGLRLSDLFRSHDAQQQAHLDYVQGRKKAFSPPAGGSMHEAGRAMDIDLSSIGVPLAKFWEIAAARGFTPIIDKPEPGRSESWHFDCRGSHDAVYRYADFRQGRRGRGALHADGAERDSRHRRDAGYGTAQDAAFLQAGLIRLGADPGKIDGVIGDRTKGALRDAGRHPGQCRRMAGRAVARQFAAEFGA